MVHLIDKDAVVAEIERRKNCFKNERNTLVKASDNNLSLGARIAMCEEILVLLNTLEVKEVDLDEQDICNILILERNVILDFENNFGGIKYSNKELCQEILKRFKAQKGE